MKTDAGGGQASTPFRRESGDQGNNAPRNKAKSNAGASTVSGAPSGAASAALSAARGASAANQRRCAALEMYPSPEVVEDTFDEHYGLGSIGENQSPAAGLRKDLERNTKRPGLGTIGDDRDGGLSPA